MLEAACFIMLQGTTKLLLETNTTSHVSMFMKFKIQVRRNTYVSAACFYVTVVSGINSKIERFSKWFGFVHWSSIGRRKMIDARARA
jgi:hypothetical protein